MHFFVLKIKDSSSLLCQVALCYLQLAVFTSRHPDTNGQTNRQHGRLPTGLDQQPGMCVCVRTAQILAGNKLQVHVLSTYLCVQTDRLQDSDRQAQEKRHRIQTDML